MPKITRFLDPYHLRKKLSKRLEEMGYPQEDIYEELWGLLWKGRSSETIEQIDELKVSGLKEGEAKQRIIGYLERNKKWIVNYEELQEQGYILGSGAVEKANDTLVARQMKRKGMRWKQEGAETILKLRTLMANKRWDTFWCQQKPA